MLLKKLLFIRKGHRKRRGSSMVYNHAFSVDLEDWYHAIEMPVEDWKGKENRLERGVDLLLSVLHESNTTATFFCLGWIGKRYPHVIKRIAAAGHEIASHGYTHEKVYNLSSSEFREGVKATKAVLEDVSDQRVVGHRSPYFSITRKSLWALEVLREEGYVYDSSISCLATWWCGISGSPHEMYRISECDILEFPISVPSFFGIGIHAGGASFRMVPYALFKKLFENDVRKHMSPRMFYVHPWEFDPHHPIFAYNWKWMLTHYFNLKSTYPKVKKLLSDFCFTSAMHAIQSVLSSGCVRTITIDQLSH